MHVSRVTPSEQENSHRAQPQRAQAWEGSPGRSHFSTFLCPLLSHIIPILLDHSLELAHPISIHFPREASFSHQQVDLVDSDLSRKRDSARAIHRGKF